MSTGRPDRVRVRSDSFEVIEHPVLSLQLKLVVFILRCRPVDQLEYLAFFGATSAKRSAYLSEKILLHSIRIVLSAIQAWPSGRYMHLLNAMLHDLAARIKAYAFVTASSFWLI